MSKIIAFSESRLSPEISLGATGGPEFSTYVSATASGFEQRNINWFYARARYDIAPGIKSSEHLEEVIELFRTHKGKAIGFRFKDWNDYKAVDEKMGVGDGKTKQFCLKKTYKIRDCIDERIIKKPVAGTVRLFVNSAIKTFTCNFQNGLIELDEAPSEGEIVSATFEFDIPVRFDIDHINLSADASSLLGVDPISLIEIRV